ncbi:MAG: SpoVG family protein [Candidatus Omnitrophota bacterium]
MEVSEVRVFLKDSPDKKLKAYATVTFDDSFVVRNIKVIQGSNGVFIAMPSRKVKHPCPKCSFKNEFRSKFCNQCGGPIPIPPMMPLTNGHGNGHENGAQAEHKDIAHPITQAFREVLQRRVLEAYELEVKKGPRAVMANAYDDL